MNMDINFSGVAIGLATFIIIGVFHPLVIKAEYYLGVRSWWLFLLLGIVTGAVSLLVHNLIISILLGVVAFSSFWSIGEVFAQKKRVEKGWFPKNPKRK
jgi:branched-subunit amino acid transport protein